MATPTPQDLLTQLQGAQKALNQKTGKDVTLPSPTAPVKPAKVPSPSDPVDASRLGESPLKAPTVTSTQSLGLQDYIASINEGNKATQKEADKLQKEQTKAKSAISSIYDKLTNSGQRAEEIYKQEGVDTARRQVDEYTNQLEAEQLANTRRQQELDKNVEGLFGGALAAAKDKANRESLSKQADLAILQNAAVRKYDTASAIAQRKIDLELEPLKTQLDALKFFYTENKAELSTKEQRLYESKIQADTMAYEEAKTSATTLQNTKLQLLQQAASQGADSSILNAIQGASTPEEAISAAGQYAGDILDRQYKQAQIANIQSEIANRASQGVGTLNGKPQTAGQAQVQGYADRLAQSNVTLTELGGDFTGKFSSIGAYLPNALKSSDRQVYEQAQRNFVTAILRRESGAAISDSEFDNAKKQYFPQAGDSAKVVAAKEANRNLVINNFYRESNVPRVALPGDIIEADGKRYRVGLDGETIEEI